jgi:uridine kinase
MVQKNATKFNNLLITVRESLHSDQFNLIAIDGYCGHGKSFLAKKLSSNLEIQCIELDTSNYLHKNKGGYINWH